MIRDKILLYENLEELHLECYSCYENTHLINCCPHLHFTPNKDFVIQRYLHNEMNIKSDQHRLGSYRRRRKIKRPHALLLKSKANVASSAYQLFNQEFLSPLTNEIKLKSTTNIANRNSGSFEEDIDDSFIDEEFIQKDYEESEDVSTMKKVAGGGGAREVRSFIVKKDDSEFDMAAMINDSDTSSIDNSTPSIGYVVAKTETIPHTQGNTGKKRTNTRTKRGTETHNPTRDMKMGKKIIDLYDQDFDVLHEFKEYFPHNNCDIILKMFKFRSNTQKKKVSAKRSKPI
jgi:hypothetical protein